MLRWREVCKRLVGRRGFPVKDARGREQDWICQAFRPRFNSFERKWGGSRIGQGKLPAVMQI